MPLLLLLLPLVAGPALAQDLTPVFATPGTECGQGELCGSQASCPYWAEISDLTGTEKINTLKEARENICNKEDRGLCCGSRTTTITTTTTSRPIRDECDTECNGTDVCTPAENCDTYKLGTNKFKELREENKTVELKQYRAALRKRICNKKLRKVCCVVPDEIDYNGTYIPANGECGTNPYNPPSSVFGGQDTAPGAFPWVALLGRYVLVDSNVYQNRKPLGRVKVPKWVCGGTLINHWYVVTAGHCLGETRNTKLRTLRLGEWKVPTNKIGGESKREDVGLRPVQDFELKNKNLIRHKDYKLSSRMLENDIMLIRLPRPAQLNGGVQLACLPLPGRAGVAGLQDWSAVGSRATVVGWGFSCYVEDNGKEFCTHSGSELNSTVGSSIQQYVEIPVLDKEPCYAVGFNITADQICGGGEAGKGSCKGDSGGGLYIRDTQEEEASKTQTPWTLP